LRRPVPVDEGTTDQFEVVVEEGPPRGDLYELEQTSTYHVVDRHANRTVMTLEGKMEATLSTDSGLWEGYRFSGVREVRMAPDGRSVIITYHDGREERVAVPE